MISGLSWDSPQWIMSGQLQIPEDKQLMVHVHSYDPWAYCSTSPTQHSWGSAADRAALADWIGQMDAWSKTYNLPVYYGEFGVTHAQTPSTGRVVWYQARQQAIAKVWQLRRAVGAVLFWCVGGLGWCCVGRLR